MPATHQNLPFTISCTKAPNLFELGAFYSNLLKIHPKFGTVSVMKIPRLIHQNLQNIWKPSMWEHRLFLLQICGMIKGNELQACNIPFWFSNINLTLKSDQWGVPWDPTSVLRIFHYYRIKYFDRYFLYLSPLRFFWYKNKTKQTR